jgi:Xaa-Pro aminopeptidase
MRELPKLVADTVKELGYGKGRIGIEGGLAGGMCWPRPINDIDLFRSELSGAKFVYAADVIWRCRTIKSPAEIDALWIATEADVRAYGELVASFELGWTERDVGRFLRNKVLEFSEDSPPPLTLASSRRVCMADVPAFDDEVSLSTGDRIALEPYSIYKGYWGSCARSFHIGPIPDEALQKSMAMDGSVEAAKKAVKPGIKSGRILEIINEALEEKGYTNSLDMGGHGVGLNFQEPPAIATGEKFVVEEGMVLAIEAWSLDAEDMSARKVPDLYGTEDYVVVTKDGSDPFPTFRKDIRCLGV